jgi:hypothetical protein
MPRPKKDPTQTKPTHLPVPVAPRGDKGQQPYDTIGVNRCNRPLDQVTSPSEVATEAIATTHLGRSTQGSDRMCAFTAVVGLRPRHC